MALGRDILALGVGSEDGNRSGEHGKREDPDENERRSKDCLSDGYDWKGPSLEGQKERSEACCD